MQQLKSALIHLFAFPFSSRRSWRSKIRGDCLCNSPCSLLFFLRLFFLFVMLFCFMSMCLWGDFSIEFNSKSGESDEYGKPLRPHELMPVDEDRKQHREGLARDGDSRVRQRIEGLDGEEDDSLAHRSTQAEEQGIIKSLRVLWEKGNRSHRIVREQHYTETYRRQHMKTRASKKSNNEASDFSKLLKSALWSSRPSCRARYWPKLQKPSRRTA